MRRRLPPTKVPGTEAFTIRNVPKLNGLVVRDADERVSGHLADTPYTNRMPFEGIDAIFRLNAARGDVP